MKTVVIIETTLRYRLYTTEGHIPLRQCLGEAVTDELYNECNISGGGGALVLTSENKFLPLNPNTAEKAVLVLWNEDLPEELVETYLKYFPTGSELLVACHRKRRIRIPRFANVTAVVKYSHEEYLPLWGCFCGLLRSRENDDKDCWLMYGWLRLMAEAIRSEYAGAVDFVTPQSD